MGPGGRRGGCDGHADSRTSPLRDCDVHLQKLSQGQAEKVREKWKAAFIVTRLFWIERTIVLKTEIVYVVVFTPLDSVHIICHQAVNE